MCFRLKTFLVFAVVFCCCYSMKSPCPVNFSLHHWYTRLTLFDRVFISKLINGARKVTYSDKIGPRIKLPHLINTGLRWMNLTLCLWPGNQKRHDEIDLEIMTITLGTFMTSRKFIQVLCPLASLFRVLQQKL